MSQTIILSLKKRKKLIIITQNKIEIIFETHFSFLSTIFIRNIEKFDFFSLIENEASMTRREIMIIFHKINLNKAFEINKIINKTLRQFARVVIKQIYFLFNKCIKKKIQSSHCQRVKYKFYNQHINI